MYTLNLTQDKNGIYTGFFQPEYNISLSMTLRVKTDNPNLQLKTLYNRVKMKANDTLFTELVSRHYIDDSNQGYLSERLSTEAEMITYIRLEKLRICVELHPDLRPSEVSLLIPYIKAIGVPPKTYIVHEKLYLKSPETIVCYVPKNDDNTLYTYDANEQRIVYEIGPIKKSSAVLYPGLYSYLLRWINEIKIL